MKFIVKKCTAGDCRARLYCRGLCKYHYDHARYLTRKALGYSGPIGKVVEMKVTRGTLRIAAEMIALDAAAAMAVGVAEIPNHRLSALEVAGKPSM